MRDSGPWLTTFASGFSRPQKKERLEKGLLALLEAKELLEARTGRKKAVPISAAKLP